MGHIYLNRIQRLIHDGPLGSLKLEECAQYESCLIGEMTKRIFNLKAPKAKRILDLIHSDVCSPITTPARCG